MSEAEAVMAAIAAACWLRKLQAGGMVSQAGKKPIGAGRPSRVFSVTKEWGGTA